MSSNGILVSYSQVIRLVEVNEDPLRWDLKMTQNNSQQWNQSMVELEGNKSENSNVSQNLRATLHQFQQKVKQWNPYELQPSNTFGRSKRGAHLLIPENEVGHSPTRASTGSQLIENIKIRWGLDMRLRGVNINCELMREAQLYSQLHGEPPARTIEPGLPLRKTWPDETVEVNVVKKKMQWRPIDQSRNIA